VALRQSAGRGLAGVSAELTDRERDVLRLLPSPLNQREIGRELYLTRNTVKTHTQSLYRKLGVSSRREAVARAQELHLL
jgi:LuxR family maltose regulon positive regulatory protein